LKSSVGVSLSSNGDASEGGASTAPNGSSLTALETARLEALSGSVGNCWTGAATDEFASMTVDAELVKSIEAPSRHEKAKRIRIV
jgi:hypothetical protein